MDLAVLISIFIVIAISIYFYLKRNHSYWRKKGVPELEQTFFFGNAKDIITGKISYGEEFLNIYKRFKARGVRHGGIRILQNPIYIPLDPEIVRCILQKDFEHFINRGMYMNEESDPLSGHLFNLEGTKWKNLRAKLTPTFTSGKMKMMFQTLIECSDDLREMLEEYSNSEEPLDVKEIIARFTTDIIGSCAFGIDCKSMKDTNSEFRKYGKKIFENENASTIKQVAAALIPMRILRKLGVSFTAKDVEAFFISVVRDAITYREQNNITRKDFLQLMIDLNSETVSTDDKKPHLTINEIAAQCFVFFVAGFETSSTTSTFALYELSINANIQEQLREEIISVLEKYNGKVTYESVSEMTYLEKVVNETLRKYPPLPVLHRVCNKDYTVPGTSVILENKRTVLIPVMGLHYDSDYYPNPEQFDPERFSEENKAKRPAYTYLPFGEGPRVCIGLRFGKLQTKLGLITILRQYKVTLNQKTKTPIHMDRKAFILGVEGGVWLNLTKLD